MSEHLVLVHAMAPPTRGGAALVIERLLGTMPSGDLDVWTRLRQFRAVRRGDFVLPGRYAYFPKLRSTVRVPLAVGCAITLANVTLAIFSGMVIGVRSRRAGATSVLSVVDEGFSQIAGAVAARVGGLPHVIWVFDLWEENAYPRTDRAVASRLERRIWRSAAAIVVHAEELAAHYRVKHGVDSRVLRTPIDDGVGWERPVGDASPTARHEWEVLVAGSVYWAQAEALQRVAVAVRQVEGAALTVVGDPQLQAERIEARYEPPRTGEALRARLQQAGLLIVGLSFATDHPDVVRTAAPARLPECLASGVPVLVHAPANSHAARYVRRWDLAAVVDEPDVAAVRGAIEAIKSDADGSALRAARARDHVLARHGASVVRSAFMRIFAP